jgi:putative DNA-invertase from lambdoid prophage Rac
MVMRVFGYSRVSTSEQADEGVSLAAQAQQIAGYAMMKGWQVDEHFVERGVSGSMPLADRPEGQRLLAAIGKGDVVVSAKLDRAFRSAADALAVLEELKDQGVGLHLIDLGGDVTGNGVSKMVFTILAAVAEGERDRIRERIRDAKRHLTAQRIFSGGSRPFGYDIVQDGETRRMVPNPAEMKVIERMQAMRKDGATYRAIGAVTGHGPKSVQRILERVERSAS